MSQALMTGLELPPALGRGKPKPEELEPWLHLVEELRGRSVRTPSELRKLLGVGYRTARNWMDEVQRRWSSGLSDDLINWRRESLYSEADAIARAAWVESRVAETPSEKASLFKVVLMANQRKASLTGLDGIDIKIKKEVVATTMVDLVARVETQHGLAPGALEAIGRNAARALSGATLQLPSPHEADQEGHESPLGVLASSEKGLEKNGFVLETEDLTEETRDEATVEAEGDE